MKARLFRTEASLRLPVVDGDMSWGDMQRVTGFEYTVSSRPFGGTLLASISSVHQNGTQSRGGGSFFFPGMEVCQVAAAVYVDNHILQSRKSPVAQV